MGDGEMNESEPLMTCRKVLNRGRNREGVVVPGYSMGGACFRTMRPPALRWHDSVALRLYGTWEPSMPMRTERFKQRTCENLSRDAASRGGMARSSDEVPDKGMERRGHVKEGRNIVPTGNGRSR
jgi:hypothetical protein